MIAKDKDGIPVDALALLHTQDWLSVLAAPQVYRTLQRPVDPAFLLRLLDIWIAYVDRGDDLMSPGTPDAQRPEVARTLRTLLQGWTPPELPAEITEAARALLSAEGFKFPPPRRGRSWDDFGFDLDEGESLDSILLWPERLAEVLPKGAHGADP